MTSSHLSWAVFYCGLDCHSVGCSSLKAAVLCCLKKRPRKNPGEEAKHSPSQLWRKKAADLCQGLTAFTQGRTAQFFKEKRPAVSFSACDLTALFPHRSGGAVPQSLPALHYLYLYITPTKIKGISHSWLGPFPGLQGKEQPLPVSAASGEIRWLTHSVSLASVTVWAKIAKFSPIEYLCLPGEKSALLLLTAIDFAVHTLILKYSLEGHSWSSLQGASR